MKRNDLGRGLALTAVCGILLTGCGESEHIIQGDGGSAAPVVSTAEQAGTGEEEQQSTDSAVGFVFASGGVTISMDADASPIVDALGEPNSYYEAASCAFEGLDKIYTYSGFEMETYPTDGKDYVSAVVLKDDSVTTPEGVAIGDSRAKVEEKYGTDYQENGSLLTYAKDGMKLNFILDGDQVISIQYQSGALE